MVELKNMVKTLINFYLIFQQILVAMSEDRTRIVGGTNTTIDKAKYLVQILNDGSIICGGTLISERYVVTAAHCFDRNPMRLSVVAGATRITDKGVRSKISKIMMPEAYNNETYHADLAVLKLETALKGDLVQPTELCKGGFKTGAPVQLFGWGRIKENATHIPIQLQTVKVKVLSRRKCAETYESTQPLTDSMFCAAGRRKDACSGDSGGPAMINNQLCGVVSWGTGCGRKKSPGVYTKVRLFAKFIADAMKK